MITEKYKIDGMHCAACSASVERVTRKLPGVVKSEVSLPLNLLTIEYDEKVLEKDAIIEKVRKAGFQATLIDDVKKAASEEEEKDSLSFWGIFSALIASLLLLYFSMGPMLIKSLPVPDLFSMHTHPQNYALLQLLLTFVVLFSGRLFFKSGIKSAINLSPNMDTLVALSSSASFMYSVVMTFLISDNPHAVHSLYYESSALVVSLVMLGKYLEEKSKKKTLEAVKSLTELTPDTALIVSESGEKRVLTKDVLPGSTVLIKSGEHIPLDGIIVKGQGSVDESMLSGESIPVDKGEDDFVTGGSILVSGAIYVKVEKALNDGMLAQIISFVREAQSKKAPISRMADKLAGVFVPAVIIIALLSSLTWLITGAEFSFALKIFTSVLVIACPCAMGLATPTAIVVGTGLGATNGILIKNGEALEITHKTNVAIFDKTGTVTEGKPTVTDVFSLAEDEDYVLTLAASVEALSSHPLAQAISQSSEKRLEVDSFKSFSGLGVSAVVDGKYNIIVGNRILMEENHIKTLQYDDKASLLKEMGKTIVYVAKDGTLSGLIAVSDKVKSDASETLKKLNSLGIKTVLLTGDSKEAGNYIGKTLGFSEVISEVLPNEKAEVISSFQASGHTVMMIGDGVNDAPALSKADVSCAIGSGSDIAINSSQIILLGNRLDDVYKAIRLSRYTITNIKQNLFWAFFYNVIGIPIAAGLLFPAFGILLSPMFGGLAMSLSSLFVVSNALRLRRKKL